MLKIGVIGLGGRLGTLSADLIRIYADKVKIEAIVDIKQKSQLLQQHVDKREILEKIPFYDNSDKMYLNHDIDAVMIGSSCETHTAYAIEAINKNIPMFLEKPVSINMKQWQSLRSAYEKHDNKCVVSFPLRVSPLSNFVKEIIDSGKIGTVEHCQAYNYVPYGGVYFHNWYRDDSITGGLFLQKATHDFDYINYILGCNPSSICAMESKQIFKGNKPTGLKCKDCEEYYTCPESPYVLENFANESATGEYCCFAKDTGNHDSATVIVSYETGMHMSYTQNFFARKKAAKRGAVFSGYKGTLEFDWYKDEINVYMHHTPKVEKHRLENSMDAHFGGDEILIRNFYDVITDRDKTLAPLKAGLLSALMCLKAKESAIEKRFCDISF